MLSVSQDSIRQLLTTYRVGLRDIGYLDAHIKSNYGFADVYASSDPVRRIEMAAFAQEPPSIRNACMGIATVEDERRETVERYRALGAPHLLALHLKTGTVRWWQMKTNGPEYIEAFRAEHLQGAMRQNRASWSPDSVLRAKSIGTRFDTEQLDFFDGGLIPALEEVVHEKLNHLLHNVLDSSKAAYTEFYNTEPDYKALFRLIFRLLAAKLLIDRQHPGTESWADADAPTVIDAVEQFYFSGAASGIITHSSVLQDARVQNVAWRQIREAFHFPNLPLEALAYVYENTLVDKTTRKQNETHATPPAFAEYILSRLPFHHLDPEERRVFEPFCGHAPFLIAALGRLRDLLPSDMHGTERHRYLTRMLSGIELDSFAREVALYSLMLADYPHSNGWNIVNGDAFSTPAFNELLTSAQVVLCNPPYGDFSLGQREAYDANKSTNKAAEALRRVLARGPQMLGFVLPRAFLDARKFGSMRREIAQRYNEVTLISLPDNAFQHSQVETALVIAHGKRSGTPISRSAFVSKQDYGSFLRIGKPTWVEVGPTKVLQGINDAVIWRTPLQGIWDALANLRQFKDIAIVHRGVEYESGQVEEYTSTEPKLDYTPGLRQVSDGFEPYFIRSYVFLKIEDKIMRGGAHTYPWSQPKVIANAARLSRGPWTIAAAVDKSGLVCYQRLYGIWPIDGTSLEVIAAVLNNPLANAFITTRRASPWDNQKRLIGQIPVPSFTSEQQQRITEMVQEYTSARLDLVQRPSTFKHEQCFEILRRIDEVVLSCYELTPEMEQQLRDHFVNDLRPRRFINIESLDSSLLNLTDPTSIHQESGAKFKKKNIREVTPAQHEKNQAAIALLQSWLDEEEKEDEGLSWEEIKRSLNTNRLSSRPLFPEKA